MPRRRGATRCTSRPATPTTSTRSGPSASFSNIAFFEPDTTVIFEAVNCTDRGDTVDDAVAYLRARHPERWSEAYEARIRGYREAGDFRLTDAIVPSLLCACEICYLPPSRQGGRGGK